MNAPLLEFYACPRCRATLAPVAAGWACSRAACGPPFPVRGQIPIFLDTPAPGEDYYAGERRKWNDRRTGHASDDTASIRPLPEREILRRNVLREAFTFVAGQGGRALDLGCGSGHSSVVLAQRFARVDAVDIAEAGVGRLQRAAAAQGLAHVFGCVANAEQLPFPDASFDAVFGKAILHHLRLDRMAPELARVLKPGGRAAFCEPLGHNPLVNLFRHLEHHWVHAYPGTDRPLVYGDLPLFRARFARAEFLSTSFLKDAVPVLAPAERALLRMRILRPLATYMTVILERGPAP